jgi:hypothetical protein
VTLGARLRRHPHVVAIALAVLLVLGPTVSACAAWSAQGRGSATGAATVMPTGSAPNGAASGSSVTISWTAARFSNGTAVAGYVVTRTNSSTGAPATVGSGCSGLVTSTSCTELNVPAGSWVYADTPAQSNWRGGISPGSAPVVVP